MDYIILDLGKDLEGACTLKGSEKKLLLNSFSHNVSMPLTADVANQKRTVGRPNIGDISVNKYLDKSTVKLAYYCVTSETIDTALLQVWQADEKGDAPAKYLEYTLSNVIISHHSISGGGMVPSESFTMNFSKIKWWYKPQDVKGAQGGQLAYEYDLTTAAAKSA